MMGDIHHTRDKFPNDMRKKKHNKTDYDYHIALNYLVVTQWQNWKKKKNKQQQQHILANHSLDY